MAPQMSAPSLARTAQHSRDLQAQNSGKFVIAAITLGCLIFVVILVAIVVPLVRRRYYKRVPNMKTMANLEESRASVIVPQEYRKGHRPTQSEIVGMMPLLAYPPNRLSVVPEEKASYMSTSPHEQPISAFVNANEEAVVVEFDPYALSRPSSHETPKLPSTAPQLISPAIPSTFRGLSSLPKLPPLIIPGLNDSPTPNHLRKASTRSAAESDDSASIYSQASASTYSAYRASPFPFSLSSIPPVPSVPDHLKSQTAALRSLTLTHFPFLPSSSATSLTDVPIISPDEETTVTRGDTVVVGQLLKSRAKRASPPTRSTSQVSHIERAGSIRPAPLEEEEPFGSRYRVKNRSGRRKRRVQENSRPNPPMGSLPEASSPELSEPPSSPSRPPWAKSFELVDRPLAQAAPETLPLQYPALEETPALYEQTVPLNITSVKGKSSASSE